MKYNSELDHDFLAVTFGEFLQLMLKTQINVNYSQIMSHTKNILRRIVDLIIVQGVTWGNLFSSFFHRYHQPTHQLTSLTIPFQPVLILS